MNDRVDNKKAGVATPFDIALLKAAKSADGFCYGLLTSWAIFDMLKREAQLEQFATFAEMKVAKPELDKAWVQLATYHVGEA